MTALEAALPELQSLPLFADYKRDEILKVCHGGSLVVSNHRDVLIEQGSPANFFGIVLSGAYKLSKFSPAGEDVIVHFSTPGDVIGAFIMAMPKAQYPISARAMGPSRFLRVPKETYVEVWRQYPNLIFKVQSLLSTRMSLLQDQKAMLKAPLASKVALLLVRLLEKQEDQSNQLLPIPLTRKEIADNLGASVESVIRIMSEWSKAGFINTNDQQIQIVRPDRLLEVLKQED